MSVKIIYQDIAAGADEDALVTTSSADNFAEPALLPFGGSGAAIATFEPYSWILDGSREILDTQRLAFWSTSYSGPDSRFETPPEITISFDERYTSPGLFLTFCPATGDYCTHMTVEWYRGVNLLKKKDFYPDSTEYFCDQTVEAWDKIVIRFHATNFPEHYVKIQKIMFGVSRTFLRPELRSVRVTQEVSIISDEVAVNTLDFTIDREDNVEYMFQFKQPVFSYDGDRLIGVFYISDSKHRGKGLWDVSCQDAIGVLDNDPYPARMLSNVPARELLEDILGGHFTLDLDPTMAAAPVSGYLPDGSRRQALQQVAFALCAMVDTSGTEDVRVYKDKEDQPKKIPLSLTYVNGTVDTSAIVTAVQITAHNYSTDGDGGAVSGGGMASNGMTVTVKAEPSSGFKFKEWQENGQAISSEKPYTFLVNRNIILSAIFEDNSMKWDTGTLPESTKSSIVFGTAFIILGGNNSNAAYRSYDGSSWTRVNLPQTQSWTDIAYGNGKYVAVASGYLYGAQGTASSFSSTTLPSADYWSSICYGNGTFVVVSESNGKVAITTNTTSWTTSNMPKVLTWKSVCYGNEKFVAVAYGSSECAYSPDGKTWTMSSLPKSTSWNSLAYGNGVFVAGSQFGYIARSQDGITWENSLIEEPITSIQDITYGNGMFVAIGYNQSTGKAYSATSEDGANWSFTKLPVYDLWTRVAFGSSKFVAIASEGS